MDEAVEHHAHDDRADVPAGAREALQHRRLRRLLVEMHRLRIEFAREVDDLPARDGSRTETSDMPLGEIFKRELVWLFGHEWPMEGGPIVAAISGNLNPPTTSAIPNQRQGPTMFDIRDLFQWDRFITPTIIKTFYWLAIVVTILSGVSGVFSGLTAMAISPFGGLIVVLASLVGVAVGVVFIRIAAEFVLIVFRINEHLGAIRDQGVRRP